MVLVSPAAANELRSLLKHSRATPGHAVRLIPGHLERLNMLIGPPEAGDEVIWDNGAIVLIISAALVTRLDGLVFDWSVHELDGQTHRDFGLRRPKRDEFKDAAAAAVVAAAAAAAAVVVEATQATVVDATPAAVIETAQPAAVSSAKSTTLEPAKTAGVKGVTAT